MVHSATELLDVLLGSVGFLGEPSGCSATGEIKKSANQEISAITNKSRNQRNNEKERKGNIDIREVVLILHD